MSKTIRSILTAAAVLAGASAFAPAWAGCGESLLQKPAAWNPDSEAGALLMPVGSGGSNIVGTWSVSFTVGGNQIDFGYQVWHNDHTEFMNSGGRAPATQNYCLGEWARTGAFSYSLNHYALSYDPQGNFNARVNIKEQVTVDAADKHYSGPFTIDVYDPNNNTLLQHVAGTVTGTRITVNSPPFPPY